jgi:hypothetical protein
MLSPEALTIRTFNPRQAHNSLPGEKFTAAANVVFTIFDKNINPADRLLRKVIIQNRSVEPCFYQHDGDADANSPVLAGGSAADDGLGSRVTFDLQKEDFQKLTVVSASGDLNIQVEKFTLANGL